MKIENLDKVEYLRSCWNRLNDALKNVNTILEEHNGDSDGGVTPTGEKRIYSFHISEYDSGGGFRLDLTGLQVSTAILNYVKEQLELRKQEMEDEIEAL